MKTIRFLTVWLLALGVGWLALGAAIGALGALIILIVGMPTAAWLLIAAAVATIAVDAHSRTR